MRGKRDDLRAGGGIIKGETAFKMALHHNNSHQHHRESYAAKE
ncbi:MAG: hypothetical protein QOJ96_1927 [Alphaproteobacteria bacterium]|nr:hypothetical protein [Alphaproteobacteria bacterium]